MFGIFFSQTSICSKQSPVKKINILILQTHYIAQRNTIISYLQLLYNLKVNIPTVGKTFTIQFWTRVEILFTSINIFTTRSYRM